MTDPVISQFAEACGAAGPLDLRVDAGDGGVLAEGSVPMPFALVGRDDACDVTLADAEVNPRHAWLQVLAGRVFAIDLGSRTGVVWPDGTAGSGWLDVGNPVRVGPFRLDLRAPPAARPAGFPPGYSPLQSDPGLARSHPVVTLEFRNGKRARDRWTVDRLVTPVGRSADCKIRLSAEDIAGYHCGLVLTPDGLWVMDLSGRGVVVNGERMRVSPLRHGSELWVGRFLVGVHYPALSITPPPGAAVTPPARPGLPDVPPAAPAGEDEVPFGSEPDPDPNAGLPSSHILADAFRPSPGEAGPVSNQILVAGSGPDLATDPAPARPVAVPVAEPPAGPPAPRPAAAAEPLPEAAALLRQFGDLHTQMFAQFRQSLVLMVRLFECLRREQLPAMQQELAGIQELNASLARLQGEVANRAADLLGSPRPPGDGPDPLQPPLPPPPADSTGLHEWVLERLNSLEREQQARWRALVGLFEGKKGGSETSPPREHG